MFCPNCGTKSTGNDQFCAECGTKINFTENKTIEQIKSDQSIESTTSSHTPQTNIQADHQMNPPPEHNTDYALVKDQRTDDQYYPKPRSNKYLMGEKQRKKIQAEENSAKYYLAALFWPIGIFVYSSISKDKPILAKQMKEIMTFSILLTLFFWWIT